MRRRVSGRGRSWLRGSAVVLLAGATAWCPAPQAQVMLLAQSEPVKVITHTRAYCDELSARAAALRRQAEAPSEEAKLVAAEGDRLCAQGQIRPGIMRLRRAIMLLRGQAHPDAAGR